MFQRQVLDDRARMRRRRRRAARAAALLLLFGLASLCGGSAPLPTLDLDMVSATNPTPPTGVTATGADRALALSWTGSTELTTSGYRVYLDDVAVLDTTATSVTVTGLQNGRTYVVTVATLSDVLGTTYEGTTRSTPVNGTPHDGLPPAAPAGLTATGGDREVALAWSAATDPEIRSHELSRDGVLVATLGAGATSYTDTGRVNGVSYAYALVAVDVAGMRSAAATASATPLDEVAPAAPTGLVATPEDRRVDLVWDANPEYDVASYRVFRDGVQVASGPGTAYSDTGLVNGTSYSYTVVAVDTSGNESTVSAAVTATPRDGVAPAAPTGLVATPGDREVALAWDANPEYDVASYRVLRDGVQVAVVATSSYTDTGLVNGTSYSWALVAVDTSGNESGSSAAVSATPRDAVAPAAPADVSGSGGDGRAVLRWTAVADYGVAAYRVLRQDGTTAVEVAAPATEATVTGLTNGTSYTFTVVAVDTSGNVSAASAPVTVVPAAPVAVPAEGAGQSGGLAVSGNGRYVVVGTRARLEASDTNTAFELYLFDRDAGTRRRIVPLGAAASGSTDPTNSSAPAISDDGRYVALATTARLLAADTNSLADVYRLDTQTGTWALASVPASGAVSSGTAGTLLQTGTSVYATSPSVVVSGDGDLVLFYSARADLVTGDTNGVVDLFAKRMSTGAVMRVSTTSAGGNLTRVATGPALAITPDGRFALFPATSATGPMVLYRKTLSGAGAGDIVVVSRVGTTDFGVYRDAGDIALSDDGRYVALVTAAKVDTATPTATYSTGFAYRKDVDTGALVAMGTGQRSIWEHRVELDPSGRFGFFSTAAAALPGDTNGHTDFYRRDLDGGVVGPLSLVTADSGGAATTGPSGSVTSTEYGRVFAAAPDRVLVLTSQALVPTDANLLRDLYAKDLAFGTVGSAVG